MISINKNRIIIDKSKFSLYSYKSTRNVSTLSQFTTNLYTILISIIYLVIPVASDSPPSPCPLFCHCWPIHFDAPVRAPVATDREDSERLESN